MDAFWSIGVYKPKGCVRKNDLDAYPLNGITAKKSADGSVAVQFGGRGGKPGMPANHERMELYGSALPPARLDP